MTISVKEDIKPISDFRKSSAGILRKLKQDHRPVILTQRGRSVAIVLDVDTYERLEYERSFKGSYERGMKDIKAGRTISHQQIFSKLLSTR